MVADLHAFMDLNEDVASTQLMHVTLSCAYHSLFLPRFRSFSTLRNGQPLTLLSPPLFILPFSLPNSKHHPPIAARKPYPITPNRKPVFEVVGEV